MTTRLPPAQPPAGTSSTSSDDSVVSVQAAYRAGRTADVIERTASAHLQELDENRVVKMLILRVMAEFDLGDAVSSLSTLQEAMDLSKHADSGVQFAAAFAH